jgi:hypothetical protein
MRKIASLALAALIAVMSMGCARQTAPRAGSATGESMLGLLPADSNGVFLVDVHRAMATPAAVKALEDEEMRQKYEKFVQEAGIDPRKDVYFLAAGIKIRPAQQEIEPTMVVNLSYDREALLGKIRERANGLEESDYEGLAIYALPLPVEGQGQKPYLAFLDASNLAVGSEAGVRAVIDVFHKKADSVRKSPEMAGILKSAETGALAWGAFALSPELVKKMIEDNAMLAPLEGVTGLHMAFDTKNKSTLMDFRTTGGTPDNNKNLADTLNGLKAMGALMAGQEPALGELLGRIEITSGADFVRIHADIPQEIMDKLQEAAKAKLGAVIPVEK